MSEFIAKLLADGQLPNTKTTLYTVPSDVQAIIRSIICVTTDTVDRTVNIYIKRTASRHIIPLDVIAQPNKSIDLDLNICLEAGDLIEGSCDVAAKVDYSIFGVLQE